MPRGRRDDGFRVRVAEASPGDDLVRPDECEWGLVQLARLGGRHVDDLEVEAQPTRRAV
jgi:hypothetical protein